MAKIELVNISKELEALEQADLLKAQEEYRKAMEEKVKGGTVEEDKPKIVTAKMGKPRKQELIKIIHIFTV